MESICISAGTSIVGLVGMVVTGASALANFIPAPDKVENKYLKIVSKLVHFVAVDIVTAAKK